MTTPIYSSPVSWLAGVFDSRVTFYFDTSRGAGVVTRIFLDDNEDAELAKAVMATLEELQLPTGKIYLLKEGARTRWQLRAPEQDPVLRAIAPHVKLCYPLISLALELGVTKVGPNTAADVQAYRRALVARGGENGRS